MDQVEMQIADELIAFDLNNNCPSRFSLQNSHLPLRNHRAVSNNDKKKSKTFDCGICYYY